MTFDRKKANEAANHLTSALEALEEARLTTLSTATRDLMDRLEAVLEGDPGLAGNDE